MATFYAPDREAQEQADFELAQRIFMTELIMDDIRNETHNDDSRNETFIIPVKSTSHAFMNNLVILHKFVLKVIQKEGRPFREQGSEEIITWSLFTQINNEFARGENPIGLSSWKDIRVELGRNNGEYDEDNVYKTVTANKYIKPFIYHIGRMNIEMDKTASRDEKNKAHYELSQWYGISLFMDEPFDETVESLERELVEFDTIRMCCLAVISASSKFLRSLADLGGVYDPETRWTPHKQYKVVCTSTQSEMLKDLLHTAEELIELSKSV